MFDLFRSREKSTRYLLGGLLMLVAISMVVTLIPGFGSSTGAGSNDQVVAQIGKEEITMREVQLELQAALRGRNIPAEMVSIYAPQIVNQIVTDRAMAYYSKKLGYTVTDADVAQVIQMAVPQLFEGGKFVGKEVYQQFLASQNMSIPEFENKMRLNAGLRRLQGVVMEGMVVTPSEIEREYRSRNEKVKLEYVAITQAKAQADIKITPEDISGTYAANKAGYRVSEKRAFRLMVIDETKAAEGIQVDEADLKRFYEQNKDQFRTQARVRARHFLLKTEGKSNEEVEKIKKRAEDLMKQAKGGADFAEIAKKNSEDTGSAVKGGDLDWFGPGAMVPEFEKAAFALKVNEISDVVKSQFGFHVIQTTGKEEARLKPFEEVKDQIVKDRQKQQVYDRMTAAADQARAAVAQTPDNAEQIARQHNMYFTKIEKAGRGEALPQTGQSMELSDAIFEMKKKGEVTPVVQVPGNKLAIAILDEVYPERQAEMAEVENQIRQSLLSERSQKVMTDKAQQVMTKTREFQGDLRKAAAALGHELKTTPEFGRDGAAEGIGAAQYVDEAFRRDVGVVFGPITANNSQFVCRIAGKTPADMGKLAEQRFDLLLKLKQKKAQERKDLFEDGLLEHLKKSGEVKIHQDVVKRLVDAFKNA